MKISSEKFAALLSAGLLAFTLSACGAEDDPPPAPEEETSQFDTFEDEDSGPDQSGSPLDEDGAPGTDPGEDPDVAPEEGESDDMGSPQNEETQDDDVGGY